MPSLMNSEDLKPHPSDLDKMFDSDEEGPEDRQNVSSNQQAPAINSHSTSVNSSGGMSMASAHAVGPVSKSTTYIYLFLLQGLATGTRKNTCQGDFALEIPCS